MGTTGRVQGGNILGRLHELRCWHRWQMVVTVLTISVWFFKALPHCNRGRCGNIGFLYEMRFRPLILIDSQYTKAIADPLDHHEVILFFVVFLVLDLHGQWTIIWGKRTPQHPDHFFIESFPFSNRLSESIASSGNTLDQSTIGKFKVSLLPLGRIAASLGKFGNGKKE